MPYGLNVASSQAGTKHPDQVRDNNPPSLLQQGCEYAIHFWTFVWGKRISCPLHSSLGENPRGHLQVMISGTVGSSRGCHLLDYLQVRRV